MIHYVYEFQKDNAVILKIGQKVGRGSLLNSIHDIFFFLINVTLLDLSHCHARSGNTIFDYLDDTVYRNH